MSDGPLVVKVGGAGVDDPASGSALWRSIIDAHRTLEGKLVLVHGGGRAVDEHLARLGMKTERVEGLRVTPPEQMGEIAGVLAGRVNKGVVGAINAMSAGLAVGLCLGDGDLLRTERKTLASGADLGRVGTPLATGPEEGLLSLLMRNNLLAVVSSIGIGFDAGLLNVNADDAAAGIAQRYKARALVLLTDVSGVLDERKSLVEKLDAAGIESMIARGVIHGGMVPKVRAALSTASLASCPVVIASWADPSAIVRIARGQAGGTRIVAGA